MHSYNSRQFLRKFSAIGLAAIVTAGSYAVAQEIPVLVQTNSNAKVMMLIDDSGSMNAMMEHSAFDATSSVATNTANDIPSIIFRLGSGASAPSTSQTLTPVLMEVNAGFFNTSSGNLYNGAALSSPTSIPVVAGSSCNNTSGSNTNCPSPGATTPQTGINSLHLYGNTSVVGSSIFTVANLAKVAGVNVTDTSGNEYLYAKYRRNDYFTLTEDWGDVWAKFDGSGNPLVTHTRVFTTAGGTVKFNNKQVFLSAGWYRIEYLRWIFYGATAAQLAALPGTNRIQTVKSVVQSLIVNNPTVKFGLASLNGAVLTGGHSGNLYTQWATPAGNTANTQPKIRNAVGTAQATLLSSLNTLQPSGGTPLTNSYIETLKYYHGEGTYTTPITSPCDGHFVVVLTDGLPTAETGNQMFGTWVQDYDGDGADGATSNNNCQAAGSARCANFADDAAYYAYQTADFSSTLTGRQAVKTFAVGLNIDFALLDNMASAGGSGQAYITNSVEEIGNALQNIVTLMVTSATAGAGAALAETFGDAGRVFRPRFQADRWTGNIDVSLYDAATDSLAFQFDMAELLAARDVGANPRKMIVGYDSDHDGRTTTTLDFSDTNASTLRPELFELFISGTESASLLEPPLADFTSSTTASTLISYIRGTEVPDLRVRDRDASGGVADLGDIVYSRPVEVGPKNGNYSFFQGYNAFTASLASEPRVLLVGANDGMLHAFNSVTGEELWTYIPSSLVKYLETLSRIPYNGEYRRSFVDGPVTVEDVYVSGQWRTYAMFGLRTGGSTYTVLDVTDRENPTLVYELSDPSSTGQSWSKPVVVVGGTATGSNPASYGWYMVVGTGEGKTTAGTNIAVYNLNSGGVPSATVIPISAADPIGTRTSNIIAVQNDGDFQVDRLYLGTEEGDVFRVRVNGASPSVANWTVAKLYDGSADKPVVASPTAVLVDNPQSSNYGGTSAVPLAVGVYFGTGHYDTLSDVATYTAVSQRMVGIFDPVNTTSDTFANVLTNLTTANLQNQTSASYTVVKSSVDGIYRVPNNKAGFYIDLATTTTLQTGNYINPTGMIVTEGVNLRGALLYSTFLPNTAACSTGGAGFVQAVNFRTGGGMVVDNTTTGVPFYNGGVPDINLDGLVNAADVTTGVSSGSIEPALDVKVETVNLTATKPYTHSNTLTSTDIRLHASNGGILPSVSSLGNRGAPVTPSILRGAHKIVVQPAYVEPPVVGNPADGSVASPNTVVPSADIAPPDLLPINIYNLPVRVLSFHEVTTR